MILIVMCYHNNNVSLFIQVRPKIEKMVGTNFKIYIPVVYRSQVVEGENYLVKVNECFGSFVFFMDFELVKFKAQLACHPISTNQGVMCQVICPSSLKVKMHQVKLLAFALDQTL